MVLQFVRNNFIFILCFFLLSGQLCEQAEAQKRYEVKLFLLEDCKISQAYTPEIKNLFERYSSDTVQFSAYFPNPSSTQSAIDSFMTLYGLPFSYHLDEMQSEALKYGIRVLPEVVVYDHLHDKIIYRGRIDNLFAGLGKRRTRATERELNECLLAIQSGKKPEIRFTNAIGCFLEKRH